MKLKHYLSIAALLCLVCSCSKDDKLSPSSFNPEKVRTYENGHEYVDLGLSVMWATCNVGATTPTEYGDYYAWGDTMYYYQAGEAQVSTSANMHWKENRGNGYMWSSYTYTPGTSSDSISKYVTDEFHGTKDNRPFLELTDDAANACWGGKWNMPSADNFKELLDTNNCDWTWCNTLNTEFGGVAGFKVTSRKNGNYIFLPAAGYRQGKFLRDGSGNYWSCTLSTEASQSAEILSFTTDNTGKHIKDVHDKNRFYGYSIRPVFNEVRNESNPSGYKDGHAYVDLGAGVKWATCNIGATTQTEFGDYYHWGDTAILYVPGTAQSHPIQWKSNDRKGYSVGTYKYCNNSSFEMTKYCTNSDYGTVDGKTELDPEDDVACAKWGNSWAMPTEEQLIQLMDTVLFTWTWYESGNSEFGGVEGGVFTSNIPGYRGNSIFLPNAGYLRNTELNLDHGSYSSKTLAPTYSSTFRTLVLRAKLSKDNSSRYFGHVVRAVCE